VGVRLFYASNSPISAPNHPHPFLCWAAPQTRSRQIQCKITPVFTRISTNREKQDKNPQGVSRKGEGLWIF